MSQSTGNPNRSFARGRKPAAKGTCLCPDCNKWVKVEDTDKARYAGSTGIFRACKAHRK